MSELHRWFANVSAFAALDNQTEIGAPYQFEYSAREAYGQNISWPVDAPLNATWVNSNVYLKMDLTSLTLKLVASRY
jgi:hypothetical protein